MAKCTKFLSVIIFYSFFYTVLSCNTANKNTADEKGSNDTTPFFSVQSFVTQEKQLLDSFPYYMYLQTQYPDGHKDSVTLSKKAFDSIANSVLKLDIVANKAKDDYTEQSFKDLTTNQVTLSYTAKNKALPVQMINVLLNEETSKVNRVYIKCFETVGQQEINTSISWKTGKSFMIIKSITTQGKPEQITKQLVSWNDTIHL